MKKARPSPAPSRPTIAAVARQAGVAQSTVSRVLNRGYASEEAQRLVERAIRKLGFSPSTAAKNLARGRAGTVGLVVESVEGEWLTEILGGIEAEVRHSDSSLLIGSLGSGDDYDSSFVSRWIADRRVDGLIFVRPGKRERALIGSAAGASIALAFIGPDEDFRVGHALAGDNQSAARQVARHLVALGHKRIAFVGGPRESIDARDRLAGLIAGLEEAGIHIPDDRVVFAPRYHVDEGRAFVPRWRQWHPRPTAVVLGNDAMAIGFMNELQRQGGSVPRDVSVVGFDDLPMAGLVVPGLTSARQEARQMGALAFRATVNPDEPAVAAPSIVLPMTLIVRESTGQPAVSSQRMAAKE